MWFLHLFLITLVLVEEAIAEDALEGNIEFVFKPLGGKRTIQVPAGNRIAIILKNVNLAPLERLTIFDGSCDQSTPILTQHVWSKDANLGDVEGSTFFSKGEVVCVWYSAETIPGAVRIDYRAFPKCGGNMKLQVGDLVNPTYPREPPHVDEHCEWTIEVEYGQRIHVEVKDFNMTLHHNYVMLEGISGYDRQHPIVTLSRWNPREYTTDFWDFNVQYVAGPQSQDRGFWIHYEAIGCPKRLLPKPENGLWSSYRDYLAFGHVMYMECRSGYTFASGVGKRYYSHTCEEDRTWSKSYEGDLEDCVEE